MHTHNLDVPGLEKVTVTVNGDWSGMATVIWSTPETVPPELLAGSALVVPPMFHRVELPGALLKALAVDVAKEDLEQALIDFLRMRR